MTNESTLMLGTVDPRFDPARPLTVNGYRFAPEADNTAPVAGLIEPEAWLIREINGDKARVMAGRVFKSEATAQAAALRLSNGWRLCLPFPVASVANITALSTTPATPDAMPIAGHEQTPGQRAHWLLFDHISGVMAQDNAKGHELQAALDRLVSLTAKPVDAPADVVELLSRFLHDRFRERTTGVSGRRIMPVWEKQLPEYQDMARGDAAKILEFLAALRTQSAESDCPSCGGLNTSCPDGCGRDKNGKLDGSTLAGDGGDHAGLVERLRSWRDWHDNPCKMHMQAADALTAQAAENAALRERVSALEERLARVASDAKLAHDALGNSGGEFSSLQDAFGIIADRARSLLGTGEQGK